MKKSKNRLIVFVAGVLLLGALGYRFGDRIPLEGLAGAAGAGDAVRGMIGKATRGQQQLEPALKGIEAAAEPDAAALDEVRAKHDAAGADLRLAWNLMASSGTTADVQGWYFAALRIQKQNSDRLQAVVERTSVPAAALAEGETTPPAEAEQSGVDGDENKN